jgi:GT2 family glycosyltransferase
MKIFALTLTWNGIHHLERLAPSLFKAALKTSCPIRWHIRDNASTDDTQKYITAGIGMTTPVGTIQYHYVNHNRDNYAVCNNFLFQKALEDGLNLEDDWVLFLNNDIEINDPYSIQKMISLIKDDVGVVGAKLLYPNRTVQHGGITFRREFGGLPYHYRTGLPSDNTLVSKNREFQAVTFAFALVRAKCIARLKGGQLDTGYNWCFEDVSCNLDIVHRQKMKVIYCGETDITHHESMSLKRNPINKIYQNDNFSKFRAEWKGIVKYDDHLYNPIYKVV